jgi:hypothetical protein
MSEAITGELLENLKLQHELVITGVLCSGEREKIPYVVKGRSVITKPFICSLE